MIKLKKKKEYCVHITPQAFEYENIMAETPEQAELIAVRLHNGGNYDEVGDIEVMRVHHCEDMDTATDNPLDETHCLCCGEKL